MSLLAALFCAPAWAHDEHCEDGCNVDHSHLSVGRLLEETATHGQFQYGPLPIVRKAAIPGIGFVLLLLLRSKLGARR